jgi:hypothetical protein
VLTRTLLLGCFFFVLQPVLNYSSSDSSEDEDFLPPPDVSRDYWGLYLGVLVLTLTGRLLLGCSLVHDYTVANEGIRLQPAFFIGFINVARNGVHTATVESRSSDGLDAAIAAVTAKLLIVTIR